MGVIFEGSLYKEVIVPDEAIVTEQPWKTIYEVIDKKYFEQIVKLFMILLENSPKWGAPSFTKTKQNKNKSYF